MTDIPRSTLANLAGGLNYRSAVAAITTVLTSVFSALTARTSLVGTDEFTNLADGVVYRSPLSSLFTYVNSAFSTLSARTTLAGTDEFSNTAGGTMYRSPLSSLSTFLALSSLSDPVGRLQAIPRSTTAALEAIGNAINTANKFANKVVINTTAGTIVTAAGATAGDVWVALDGTTAHTPV